MYIKPNENNHQSFYENEKEYDAIEEHIKGVIGELTCNTLRMIDNNCNFVERTQEDVCRILFNEEIK